MRKLIAAAATAALIAGGAAATTPASAAEQFTVVFTAGASVYHGNGGPADVYFPGFGPDVTAKYSFDTDKKGLGGTNFCVIATSDNGTDANCGIRSTGAFGAVQDIEGAGATCIYSTGRGSVDRVTVNGTNIAKGAGLKVEWPAAAGTILPFFLTTGSHFTSGGTVVGQGAVQVTGAAPGTCGIGGPTNDFEVTGYAVASL